MADNASTDKEFPTAQPHGEIEEVFPDVFVVTGRYRMAPMVKITRNMIIVRSRGELTLINGIRLTRVGERALDELGTVKHLVRLGAFHSVDDPYLKQRYKPSFYCSGRQRELGDLHPDVDLDREDIELPIEDATVFNFQETRFPESALILDRADGVLITCDSVQNIVDTKGMSVVGKIVTRAMGLKCCAGIGGPWRKAMTRKDDESANLRRDFRRLLERHEFSHLLSAHGPPLEDRAHEALRETVKSTFG